VRLHKRAPRGALPQSSKRHGPDCTAATVTGHRLRPDLPYPPGHQQHFLLDIRLPSTYCQCRGSYHRRERPLGGCGLLGLRGPGGCRPVRFVAGLERTHTSAGMLQWAGTHTHTVCFSGLERTHTSAGMLEWAGEDTHICRYVSVGWRGHTHTSAGILQWVGAHTHTSTGRFQWAGEDTHICRYATVGWKGHTHICRYDSVGWRGHTHLQVCYSGLEGTHTHTHTSACILRWAAFLL